MALTAVMDPQKAFGYSYWPWDWPHWWMTLTAADQGAWVSGVGALSAAAIALWISDHERRHRTREVRRQARIAAAYMQPDLQRLVAFGKGMAELLFNLSELAEIPADHPDLARANDYIARELRPITGRVDMARISSLPDTVSEYLARGLGGMPFVCDSIARTIETIRLDMFDAERDRRSLKRNVQVIGVPLSNLIPFYMWYGNQFPDSKEDVADPSIVLIEAALRFQQE